VTSQRPFRFGVQAALTPTAAEWTDLAKRVEALGYDTFSVPDHIGGRFSWAPALMAAAAATTTLRIGTLVLDNDFRHPALTASEAATLDVLSNGRLELGIGAGWMLEDYTSSGIPFDSPGVRVDRLEESLKIIKPLLRGESVTLNGTYYQVTDLQGTPAPVQKPSPPIFLGAGGKRMLALAAREADIVGIAPPALPQGGLDLDIAAESVARQVSYLRESAGDRINDLELQMLNQYLDVTDHPRDAAEAKAEEWGLSVDVITDSPHMLIGSVESIVETLLERRERFGISYIVVRPPVMEAFAPVVSQLHDK
jgi:probable F420-dependent oxidoreductase